MGNNLIHAVMATILLNTYFTIMLYKTNLPWAHKIWKKRVILPFCSSLGFKISKINIFPLSVYLKSLSSEKVLKINFWTRLYWKIDDVIILNQLVSNTLYYNCANVHRNCVNIHWSNISKCIQPPGPTPCPSPPHHQPCPPI